MMMDMEKIMRMVSCAVLFIIVSLPATYKLTDSLLKGVLGKLANGGCPTMTGIVVHGVVFSLLFRGLMEFNKRRMKWRAEMKAEME